MNNGGKPFERRTHKGAGQTDAAIFYYHLSESVQGNRHQSTKPLWDFLLP
jgi:hypothetical protein